MTSASHPFARLETPRLILDRDRLERNATAMRVRCRTLGVALRPHLKTSKSLDVARIATEGAGAGVTVSTLKEAEHFARGGHRDILYATAVTPQKLARVAAIQKVTRATVHLCADSAAMVGLLVEAATGLEGRFSLLVEVDCGEHRSGAPRGADKIVDIARLIDATPGFDLSGVMTHAGHSYGTDQLDEVRRLAAEERDAAVAAADALRRAGLPCPIISIGSTPTLLHADHLDGVTEVRAGIYMFWDLAQLSRGMCLIDDIAVSVLATVIGHNRWGGSLVLDAGALALSKDIGAQKFMPEAGYGWLCDPATMQRLGTLAISGVHQEHANVPVMDEAWYDRLPIGTMVRILPNHACLTCAAYESYDVVSGGDIVASWPRINGW
jgi:D-serine deaminase-like pyridoxal phosphate-dependent protein